MVRAPKEWKKYNNNTFLQAKQVIILLMKNKEKST